MVNLEVVPGTGASSDGAGADSAGADEQVASGQQARVNATIVSLNQEFRVRTDNLMSVPLAVLIDQRDRAVQALEEANELIEQQHAQMQAEQDTFIAFLMEDHQKQLAALEQQLSQAKLSLERQAVLAPVVG